VKGITLPAELPMSARDLEIFRGGLAFIRDFLVLDDLTLIQTGETRRRPAAE
jgi:hypothetical protein